MSAHGTPATCRCLWCQQTFATAEEASTHMHLLHRGHLQRTQDAEAAARLQHYHEDREAVRKGRALPEDSVNTPRGAGRALAERMRDLPQSSFLAEMDAILDHIRAEMQASGRQLAVALMICREIRQSACEWRQKHCGSRATKSGG